jgi:PhoH-like ATPase
MTEKTFVLDTNVLLYDPESISCFPRHRVVIPLLVLEELDKMKRLPGELGKNSRAVFRYLDSLKSRGVGSLHDGVKIENGSTITILLEYKSDHNHQLPMSSNDNRIIMSAFHLQKGGMKVVFVTKDFGSRIKAEAIGLEVEDYENLKFSYDSLYKGIRYIQTDKDNIDLFFKDRSIDSLVSDSHANEYFVMTSPEKSSGIAKYQKKDNKMIPLLKSNSNIWGINPRNVEQRCAMDLLLRDDIKLVTLMGPAGTGKTLLALACGMRKVFDEGVYSKIMISRPIMPLGRDIGYLPGTKEEKLFHWMQPIYDNLEFLCASSGTESREIF